MCGISGIVLKGENNFNLGEKITRMSDAISHRGPDGEGFMLAGEKNNTPYYNRLKQNYGRSDLNYIPAQPVPADPADRFLALAHRRLSIIDLTETGHQPMCNANGNVWITFNGEIYNYVELKSELKTLGHQFVSESDTEVILAAYREWGFNCVEKFNGMWAFCIYDAEKKLCFASRDRFGVKPFYYINNALFFAFASEQKAFTVSGLCKANINRKAVHNYLVNGLLENEPANFFEEVTELWPGNNLVYKLQTKELQTSAYYHLSDHIHLNNDHLSDKELTVKISETLENAIRIRLRSDVEVGTCLSGGIDSSAIAAIISEITRQPLHCFTAVFKGRSFNEEHFSDIVAAKINARHFKTEPTLQGFIEDVDALIFSQDVPIWSTSTYAQYKVMALAKQNNIKVVLDGQGADELFGGYHHHFVAKWNNLLSRGKIFSGLSEISASVKSIPNPLAFYLKERLKHKSHFGEKHLSFLFKPEFLKENPIKNPFVYFDDMNRQLVNDIYETRLKSFLKCEDRCGMWHSVESRTPFADDIELINLLFSFRGNRKIKNGVSKYLLREAVKSKLPPEIYGRYDKRGFETPMQEWVQKMRPQIFSEIKQAGFDFVNYKNLEATDSTNQAHNNLLFKLFILSRWQSVFNH